jgi:AraC-like DNA-binding protein
VRPGTLETVRIVYRDGGRAMHSELLHGHRFFVLLYIERGGGVLRLAGGECEMGAGDIHFVAPGELHDTSGLLQVKGWVVEFTPDALGESTSTSSLILPRTGRLHSLAYLGRPRRGPTLGTVPEAQRPHWSRRFATMANELTARPPGYREAIRAHLSLVLIDVARLMTKGELRVPSDPLVDAAFDVIEARYTEPISLKDVARAVSRSPAYLTTLMREQTGMTVVEWIVERRMAEARRLLQETSDSIARIADRVGYADVTHFIRLFRRAHGTTPNAWRKGTMVEAPDA